MGRMDWMVGDINEKIVLAMNRLLEDGENYVFLSRWNSEFRETTVLKGDEIEIKKTLSYVLGLTDERLYAAVNVGFFGFKIGLNWARPLSTLDDWSVRKHKDSKGNLEGYRLTFGQTTGFPAGDFTSPPAQAEPFLEVFESAMARFAIISSTADLAGQLSAMHQLWTEGVLSDSEHEKAKALFLGRSPDQEQVAERNLRGLKQLKDAGVLTEAEFAAKKWEILSS